MTPRECAAALVATVAVTLAWSMPAAAQVSILGEGYLGQGAALVPASHEVPAVVERGPFIAARGEPQELGGRRQGSSLFAGQAAGSLFAPLPERDRTRRGYRNLGGGAPAHSTNASAIDRLRQIIGHAESRTDGYDAINYGARRLPARRPTELTLGEIYAWIAATPGQPHAIGRYQFIPSTLKRLARKIGAGEHEQFSPRLQDLLADQLFAEAGLNAFSNGLMPRRQFMNNLAEIWAGLPNSSGQSHYHGYAGNRATMTWAHFDAEMAAIFPS